MKIINDKLPKMKLIENKEGVAIEELLRIKYVDEGKNTYEIADELGISYATCCKWLQMAGIYSKMLNI